MRGEGHHQQQMFLYVSLEEMGPADPPLLAIRAMVDQVLRRMDDTFDEIHGDVGRSSIALERRRAWGVEAAADDPQRAHGGPSRRATTCRWRWFVGPGMNDAVWQATGFTRNRDRLLEANGVRQFSGHIMRLAMQRGGMSSAQVSLDETMAEARASLRSFRPKRRKPDESEPEGSGRNREVDFRWQQRRNETRESVTDPEARRWRKTQTAEAKRSDLGQVLGENRQGLIGNVQVTRGYGRVEQKAAVEMARELPGGAERVTVGVDRGDDTPEFVERLREWNVTPHGTQNGGAAQRGGWPDEAARRLVGEPAKTEAGGGILRMGGAGRGAEEGETQGPEKGDGVFRWRRLTTW